MKKIMFNDHYGLTEAVLSGRKTMTRRIITCPKTFKGELVAGFHVYKRQSDNAILEYPCMYDADERNFDGGQILPKYKIGEVVAVAQSYRSLYRNPLQIPACMGWFNKMFLRDDLIKYMRESFIAGYVNGATTVNYMQCQDCPKKVEHPNVRFISLK